MELLASNLKDIPTETIVEPENYVAIPALQQISYCFDSDELRDMYATLLTSSMRADKKWNVHPGFVGIISQLCPDEAKFLKYLSINSRIPTITLKYVDLLSGIDIIRDFSDISEKIGCERPYDVSKYIDNLVRLGLLQKSMNTSLSDLNVYEPLKHHPYITSRIDEQEIKEFGLKEVDFDLRYVDLTTYGTAFCNVCLN